MVVIIHPIFNPVFSFAHISPPGPFVVPDFCRFHVPSRYDPHKIFVKIKGFLSSDFSLRRQILSLPEKILWFQQPSFMV